MDKFTILWWLFISLASIFNILDITTFFSNTDFKNNDFYLKNITILSMIYTYVGALRSFFPKKDVERICMVDSVFSYPFFGRTIATIAEISFSQFIVLIFKGIIIHLSKKYDINLDNFYFFNYIDLLVPLISIAQIFCWSGCLTTNSLWNVIEESIWTISSLIIILIAYSIYTNVDKISDLDKRSSLKKFLTIFILFSIVYFVFMVKVDVPMYYNRYLEFCKKEKSNDFSFIKSIKDMCQCKQVTKDFNIWKHEMPWKTGYFVVGVYATIVMTKWFKTFTS